MSESEETPAEQRAALRRRAVARFIEKYGNGADAIFSTFGDPIIERIMNEASDFRRLAVFASLKTAARMIRDHHVCDFCERQARFIRAYLTNPEEIPADLGAPEGMHGLGIYIVCPIHHTCSSDDFGGLVLAKLTHYAATGERVFFAQPVIVGPRIGESTGLPNRVMLSKCSCCSADIWVASDALERTVDADGDPIFMCWSCAFTKLSEDRGDTGNA
jgi:hypothetical protein